MKNVLLGFAAAIAAYIIVAVLFFWGYPMTENNKKDFNAVKSAIEMRDSVQVTGLMMSPLEEIAVDGKVIDCQTVKYTAIKDSAEINSAVIVEVKKSFLKYRFKSLH